MGCDIHGYIEVKSGDKWFMKDRLDLYRNYAVFGKLFNVRNYYEYVPIVGIRGLPEDVNQNTKFWSNESANDTHSHSWISANEIAQIDFTETVQSPYTYYNKILDDGTEEECGRFMHHSGMKKETYDKLKEVGAAMQDCESEGKRRFYYKAETIEEAFGEDWTRFLRYFKDEYYDDKRLVVWFDN